MINLRKRDISKYPRRAVVSMNRWAPTSNRTPLMSIPIFSIGRDRSMECGGMYPSNTAWRQDGAQLALWSEAKTRPRKVEQFSSVCPAAKRERRGFLQIWHSLRAA
jgi:hypothetical protein